MVWYNLSTFGIQHVMRDSIRAFSMTSCTFVHLVPKFISKRSLPSVSILNLHGMISAGQQGRFGGRRLNILSLEKSIDKAFSQKNLTCVILSINSPGGSPVQSELIGNKIMRLSKQKNVKVVSFVEDLAASGGYWLACAGEEIYCTKNSMVGSIGVISARFGLSEFIRRFDIDWRVHTAGKSKSFMDPFQPEKDEDIQKLKVLLKVIHDNFIIHVKEQRGGRLKSNDDVLFNGDVWAGQKAVDHGLVDGIHDLSSYINDKFGVENEDVNVVRVNAPKIGLASIFGDGTSFDLHDLVSLQRFKILT